MRHAWFGNTSTTVALDAWLQTATEHCPVELYDITLTGLGYPAKLTLRWTDFEHDVIFPTPDTASTTLDTYMGGYHITASGVAEPSPKFMRGTRKDVIGVEVDTLDVDIYPDGTEFLPAADGGGSTGRFTIADALRYGMFDGATLILRRLHLPLPPTHPITPASISNRGDLGPGDTSLGAITLFAGLVTQATGTRSKLTLTVKSGLEKLSVGMPRNIYQATCLNDVYDGLCGVSRTGNLGGVNFQRTARVSTITPSNRRKLMLTTSYPTDTAATQTNGYWVHGTAQFTTGPMAGLSRSVLTSVNAAGVTACDILVPLPAVPAAGDTVILQAGCNKLAHDTDNPSLDDCTNKFGNFVDAATETLYVKNGKAVVSTRAGATAMTVHTNGTRFRGCPRVPPPDSAT